MAYENRGIDYLRRKLETKRLRVLKRYKYYEMKNSVRDFGISTPPDLRAWNSTIGWCAKAVDSLADRLTFREFRNDNFNLNEIYRMNNPVCSFAAWAISLVDTEPKILPPSPALIFTTTFFSATIPASSFACSKFSAATLSACWF